jgi:major membrane immunogen (membrane-anchored lipoprotein)
MSDGTEVAAATTTTHSSESCRYEKDKMLNSARKKENEKK